MDTCLNLCGKGVVATLRPAQPLILVAKSICTRDYAHSSPRSTREQNPGRDFATNINLYDNVHLPQSPRSESRHRDPSSQRDSPDASTSSRAWAG